MSWRTIETAPKDGTEVLGWRKDCGVFMMRFTCPIDFLTEREMRDMDEDTAETQDWFCADFVCGGRLDADLMPTHWMPLPDPPASPDQPTGGAGE